MGALSVSCLLSLRGYAGREFFKPQRGETKDSRTASKKGGLGAEGTPNHVVPLHALHRSPWPVEGCR
jgi:hypothetical protein